MSTRKGNDSFLSKNYAWLALAIAFAVLALGVIYAKGQFDGEGDEIEASAGAGSNGADGIKTGVEEASLEPLTQAMESVKVPTLIPEVSDEKGSFMASARRVFCKCGAPIDANAKTCPFCSADQADRSEATLDSDDDGMNDAFEKLHGFDLANAADGAADADGDGYTNAEECAAKTNPKDASSHKPYVGELELSGEVTTKTLAFFFQRWTKTPNGYRVDFFDCTRRNSYGKLGTTYSVREGEAIGDTGYVVVKCVEKSDRVKAAGSNLAKTEDATTVVIRRKSDSKEIELRLDEKDKPVDVEARVTFKRAATGDGESRVVVGSVIDLRGQKFTVKSIDCAKKPVKMTIQDVATGKIHTLTAIEG